MVNLCNHLLDGIQHRRFAMLNPISSENSIKFGIDQCILCSDLVRFDRWSLCMRLSCRPFFLVLAQCVNFSRKIYIRNSRMDFGFFCLYWFFQWYRFTLGLSSLFPIVLHHLSFVQTDLPNIGNVRKINQRELEQQEEREDREKNNSP